MALKVVVVKGWRGAAVGLEALSEGGGAVVTGFSRAGMWAVVIALVVTT